MVVVVTETATVAVALVMYVPMCTSSQVQEVHAQYLKAVVQLFEDYRDIYDPKAEPVNLV